MTTPADLPLDSSPFRRKPHVISLARGMVRAWRRWRAVLLSGGRVTIGRHVVLGRSADIRPPHRARIGDFVAIGKNFTAEVDFVIGSEVLVSSNVSLVGNQHRFDDPDNTVYRQGRLEGDRVVLEGDNLIGFGTIIVGSVTIGQGTIVGAGSVVTRSLPPRTICAGVPARPLRARLTGTTAAGT